jgi:hypothetical protein
MLRLLLDEVGTPDNIRGLTGYCKPLLKPAQHAASQFRAAEWAWEHDPKKKRSVTLDK